MQNQPKNSQTHHADKSPANHECGNALHTEKKAGYNNAVKTELMESVLEAAKNDSGFKQWLLKEIEQI